MASSLCGGSSLDSSRETRVGEIRVLTTVREVLRADSSRCRTWATPFRGSVKKVPKDASIYVAGHTGLVGSAVVRCLRAGGFSDILAAGRGELDLRDQAAVDRWFAANRDHVREDR